MAKIKIGSVELEDTSLITGAAFTAGAMFLMIGSLNFIKARKLRKSLEEPVDEEAELEEFEKYKRKKYLKLKATRQKKLANGTVAMIAGWIATGFAVVMLTPVKKYVSLSDAKQKISDAQLLDRIKNMDLAGKVKNVDFAGKVKNVDLAGKVKNIDISDRFKDMNLVEKVKDIDIAEKVKDMDISDKLKELELSGKLKEVENYARKKGREFAKKVAFDEIKKLIGRADR